ncbi:MAG TPA: hypothetical protein VJ385_02020 [Fibrobacteria bacterium]|nr:hypothetical protein [Fibrobacteria bacterium]
MALRAWRRRAAETCLEAAFLPEKTALTSFLVNALYLFGDNAIVAFGGAPEEVTAELTRLGHGVSAGPGIPGRVPRGTARNSAEGRFDRAVLLAQALGRGGDGDILEQLRAMHRAVRPGGLVCFHAFDRDRAWSLAGTRHVTAEGRRARVDVAFDPSTGRISARLAGAAGAQGKEGAGCGGFAAVKAWNRSEIEALLRGAGLRLERVYGDWEGRGPEAAASGRLIVVAAKPRRARKRAGTGKGGSP